MGFWSDPKPAKNTKQRQRLCPACRGARATEHPLTIIRNGRRQGSNNTIVITCGRCHGSGDIPK